MTAGQIKSLLARIHKATGDPEPRIDIMLANGFLCRGNYTLHQDYIELNTDDKPPMFVDVAAIAIISVVS